VILGLILKNSKNLFAAFPLAPFNHLQISKLKQTDKLIKDDRDIRNISGFF